METTVLEMFQSTVIYSGTTIYIKPFCDFFGISYRNQIRKVAEDPILSRESQKKGDINIFGDKKKRIALSKKGFLRWIQRLNFNIVRAELKEKLEVYQNLIFDYLYGSPETEKDFRLNYSRLSKLKKLKSKLSTEISKCETEVNNYINHKYQVSLKFPASPQIEK